METKKLQLYGSYSLLIALIAIIVLILRVEHKLDTVNTIALLFTGAFGLCGLIFRFMEVHSYIREFMKWVNTRKPLRLLD